MKKAFHALLTFSPWSLFHVCMIALTLTGLMLAFSAGDLGAFAPLLVAEGIALVFFAASCEAIFLIRCLILWFCQPEKQTGQSTVINK